MASATLLSAADPTVAAIKQTVRDGLNAQQSAITRPTVSGTMSASAVADLKEQVHATLARYFTGKQLDNFSSIMDENVDTQMDGSFVYLGGGVDDLQFESVDVVDSSATVVATGTTWAKSQIQWDESSPPSVSEPRTKGVTFTLQLQKVDSSWLISNEEMTIPPDETP